MRRYADSYIDQLVARSDYDSLVSLHGILMSGASVNLEMADYGLPSMAFVFVESIVWFAQSIRSGAWTYFEVTPSERQSAMHRALASWAPTGFAEKYKFGSENWMLPEQMKQLDRWIDESEPIYIEWLADFQRKNHTSFWPLYA